MSSCPAFHRLKQLLRNWHLNEYLWILVCAIPYGVVVNYVMVPHAVVGGGLTGICEILYFASHTAIPIWASQLAFNALFLLVAIFTVGWRFCARTVYCVLCLTLWLKVLPPLSTPPIADPLIALLLAAVLNGVAMGIIFLNNGSTGGTDIVAMVIHKYRPFPLGRILMAFDFVIMSSAWFLPEVHSLTKICYALTYTFVATAVIDGTMLFFTHYRQSVS